MVTTPESNVIRPETFEPESQPEMDTAVDQPTIYSPFQQDVSAW